VSVDPSELERRERIAADIAAGRIELDEFVTIADVLAGRDPIRMFRPEARTVIYARAIDAEGIARCGWISDHWSPDGCHRELYDWDADHIVAWSQGGPTVAENGQALCRRCNLRKGNRPSGYSPIDLSRQRGQVGHWPSALRMRRWVSRCVRDYFTSGLADYFVFATPGAGKTMLAVKIAHERFLRGEIDIVVFVVPTNAVRRQWCAAPPRDRRTGHQVLQLCPTIEVLPVIGAWNGFVLSYSQLMYGSGRNWLRQLCRQYRVMIVTDEIHHAAEQNAWGIGLADTLASGTGARFHLSMSGTPFRTDNRNIAGIRGQQLIPDPDDEGGLVVRPDFSYTYREALLDGDPLVGDAPVVREVFFPLVDGTMRWISRYAPDEVQTATFRDDVLPGEARQRRRTFLWANGQEGTADGLRSMLRAANDQLSHLRQGRDPRAQGLVACIDFLHVAQVADMLYDITGERPLSVTYQDGAVAADMLRDFAGSGTAWLVTIRMASEGYDNNRLRVGVYAATYETRMFFRQFVGRFVRYNPALGGMLEQPAYVFLPNDPPLVRHVTRINAELQGYEDEVESLRIRTSGTAAGWERVPGPPRRPVARRPDEFQPLSATGEVVATRGPVPVEELLARQEAATPTEVPDWMVRARMDREFNAGRRGISPAYLERWLRRRRERAA